MPVTISQENYLKTIWELSLLGQAPYQARVAQELNVSPAAVSLALRRLAKEDYVTLSGHGLVKLTSKGRQTAEILVRRHRLIERLLTDVLDMKWYLVHEEAEKLEHAISPEFERHLALLFEHKKDCPHGYPLAIRNFGTISKMYLLQDARTGARLVIARVYEKDQKFLEFLDEIGIFPGTNVKVVARGYDETVTLQIKKKKVSLGKAAAARIWVKPRWLGYAHDK